MCVCVCVCVSVLPTFLKLKSSELGNTVRILTCFSFPPKMRWLTPESAFNLWTCSVKASEEPMHIVYVYKATVGDLSIVFISAPLVR